MSTERETRYKLVRRDAQRSRTTISMGSASQGTALVIGDGQPVIIAGPCAVEHPQQIFSTAAAVKAAGAQILRGGAFKPRTSPYQFQGLGLTGLKLLAQAREQTGLPVITEVMEPALVDTVAEYADILQIGARNMQNYPLLLACGKQDRPVLLKRGLAATVEEWLLAAEYILCAGNPKVILCERGIRSYDPSTRNVLDLSCVPFLRELTHLPVIVDPSHGTGRRELVQPMSRAAIAAGADGLLLEVHTHPDMALSDSQQTITPEALRQIVGETHLLASTLCASPASLADQDDSARSSAG